MRLQLAKAYQEGRKTNTGASAFILNWLKDRGQLLDSLLKNLHGMAYCCLLDECWTMLFISDGCYQLTGYRPEDLFNNGVVSYEELTLESDREIVREHIMHAIASGERFDVEYQIRTAQGEVRWVSERGTGILNHQGEAEALQGIIQDITTRKASEQALREAEQRYRGIFENITEGIFQTSPKGQYISANPALARIYGFNSALELIENLNDIGPQLYLDPNKRREFSDLLQLQEQITNFESQVRRRDGSIIWISENARAVRGLTGQLLYYEGTVEDITERKNHNELIEYKATHDELTDLPNRALLKDRLQQAMNQAERSNSHLAVVFVDLDQFKNVNDSLGHHAGDQLLITMANRLSDCIRDSDTVARPGGDEFVLLLANLHSLEVLSQTLQRILEAVAEPCIIDQREFIVTCSLGISMYPSDGKDSETLLKNADTAMYKAKQVGKNNFQFFTKELNSLLVERLEMEYRLRYALIHDEFELMFQPKMSFGTQQITGMEALIRWRSPHQGLISPAKFIPIAEDSILIEHIGAWVMQSACAQAAALFKRTGKKYPVSVNVSPRQFYQKDLVQIVEAVLRKTGLEPGCLEIEITEGTLIRETYNFVDILKSLKSLGVKLAIDDFGTGYSSLGYIKHFPVDNLKIDQSFVRGLEQDVANQAILKAIIVLGHNLGLNIIAEGVETISQRDFLISIGCDEMQGFLYSKPLSMPELENFIASEY